MKCYVFYHLVNGRDVRMTATLDSITDLEADVNAVANSLAKCPFVHFVEDGKLVIVNMANVAYIKITKAE